MTTHVITANRLADGLVVFFSPPGNWSTDISAGHVTSSEDAERTLHRMLSDTEVSTYVVGPYAIEVETLGGDVRPIRYRERIRLIGPSVETRARTETSNVSL